MIGFSFCLALSVFLLSSLLLAADVSGFTSFVAVKSASGHQLFMGLFDWNNSSNGNKNDGKKYQFGEGKTWTRDGGKRVYRGVSKADEAKKKKNTYQGAKITIRQDEDAAMWIDDGDKDASKKKSGGKRNGWF